MELQEAVLSRRSIRHFLPKPVPEETIQEIAVEYTMLDIGLYLQTFCLLAHDKALATCILAATVMYPDLTHDIFSIPDTKRLVIGAALGWPDPDAAVNRFERERGSEDEFIHRAS